MPTRSLTILLLSFLLVADQKLGCADTVIDFPEQSIGSLYFASPDDVHFGADSKLTERVTEWEFFAFAAGRVRLPEGKLIRLSLNNRTEDMGLVDKPDWVKSIPNHTIHSLHVVNTPFRDELLSEFSNWTGLQDLRLVGCDVTSAAASTLSKLTQLKRLYLSRLPLVDDTLLVTVAELPNLQEIYLRRLKLTDSGMAVLSRSHNLTLVLVDGVAISDAGIASLTKLSNLLYLNVYAEEPDSDLFSPADAQTSVTDVGLEHIGDCSQLISLNIHGAKVSLDGLQRLFRRCPNLRYLGISRSAVDLGALDAASSLAHLETIRITGTVLGDQEARQLSQLKQLREIDAELNIGNESVEQLASLQRLESLRFSGEADDQCMSALTKLPNLKDLSIVLTRVTDEGLEALKGSARLERVHLSGRGFSSRCLQTIATWPNLTELFLESLGARQDGQGEWSEMSKLPAKLRSLDFIACPEIGDDELRVIGSLPFLESLSIRAQSIKAITDAGAGHLATASKLRSLTLPSFITDQGLSRLRGIESLEHLEIVCLATSDGLATLGEHQRLRSLTIGSPDLSIDDANEFATRHQNTLQFRFAEVGISRTTRLGSTDPILRRGSESDRAKLNVLEGKTPPGLKVTAWTSIDGEVQLESLHGKVVLLDFWGTWCGACLNQLPHIRDLYEKYHERGLVVITIHSTYGADNMASFLSKNPFPWPNASDVDRQTEADFAVSSWPSTYLIDRQGKLRFANPIKDHLEDAVRLLIEE
ncbi:redoxin domain-containing protein [Pirellulaceae bacterium SH449]